MKTILKKTGISILLAAMLLMVFVFAGCSGKPQEAMRVLALKGPTGMGLAYLTENTEDYTLELSDAPDVVTGKFINGETDIACVPINLASVLYNKTEGNVVLLNVNTLGVLYILENGESIQSIEDLRGKKIYATGQGSTPEYVLNYILAANGLTDDVTVEYVGEHATLATMVASGEAEIAMLPEPNVSAVLAKSETARVALDLTEEWSKVSDTPLVQGCTITTKTYYEANKARIDQFLSDYAASVEKTLTDEGAADRIAELGILPSAGIAKSAIPNCNIVCVTGADARTYAEGMLTVLFDANPKSVGGALPADDFYVG